MKKSKVLLMLFAVGALLVASSVQARPGRGPGDRWLKELKLTDAQRDQVKEIRKNKREQHHAKREMVEALAAELGLALKADTSDSELLEKFKKIEDMKREMAEDRFQTLLKIRQVLTPEQRQKMRAKFLHKRRGREGRRGRRGRRGGGF